MFWKKDENKLINDFNKKLTDIANDSTPFITEETLRKVNENTTYTDKLIEKMKQEDRETAYLIIYGNKDGPEKDKYSSK